MIRSSFFYRFGALFFLVLTLGMIWTPAHASFPASSDSSVCTVGPCTEYRFNDHGGAYVGPWRSTPAAACADGIGHYMFANYALGTMATVVSASASYCGYTTSKGSSYGGSPDARTVAPSTPVYSCPENATLSGSTCTCNPGSNEVAGACVVKVVCEWAIGQRIVVFGTLILPASNPSVCQMGCHFDLAAGEGAVDGFKWKLSEAGPYMGRYALGSMVGSGAVCSGSEGVDSGGGPATADAPVEPVKPPESGCPPGEVVGAQIIVPGGGGGYVCGPPSSTENKTQQSTHEVDASGAEKTTTTTTTTNCSASSCNTTTNISVSSGGSTTNTSATTTQTKEAFCKSNPNDKSCSGSGDGKGGETGADQGTPAHPKLWVKKYPDGVAGVFAAKKAAMLDTPIGKLAPSLMPNNIPTTGALPVWNLALDFGPGMNFGSHNVAPSAEIWGWAKIFLIISALLLARALIFGG